jgi:hypothetical protein
MNRIQDLLEHLLLFALQPRFLMLVEHIQIPALLYLRLEISVRTRTIEGNPISH